MHLDGQLSICLLVHVIVFELCAREYRNVLQEHRVSLDHVHIIVRLLLSDVIVFFLLCLAPFRNLHKVLIDKVLVFVIVCSHKHFDIVLSVLPLTIVLNHVFNQPDLLVLWLQTIMTILQTDCECRMRVVVLSEPLDSDISHFFDWRFQLGQSFILFFSGLTSKVTSSSHASEQHISTHWQTCLMVRA